MAEPSPYVPTHFHGGRRVVYVFEGTFTQNLETGSVTLQYRLDVLPKIAADPQPDHRPPVEWADGPEKVTGAAVYPADVNRPATLVGKCLRGPYPLARI